MSKNRDLIILILSLIFGLAVLPSCALLAFGILTPLTAQLEESTTESLVSSTPCVGLDDKTNQLFTGFIDKKDNESCVIYDSENKAKFKGEIINKNPDIGIPVSTESVTSESSVNIASTIVLIFRIMLYCSICLIPIVLIGAVIWYVVQTRKSGKEK